LPEKDDPDTYIRRHGPEVWEMQAAGALSGLDFLLEHGLKTHGNSPEGKAQTMEDAMELIKRIQDPVRKALIITHVAQAMGVKEDSLWRKLENMPVKRPQPMNRPTTDLNSTQQAVCQTNRAEQELLGFILDQPRVLPLFLEASLEIWLTDPILKSLWLVMSHHYSIYGSLNPQELVEDLQSTPHLREALLTILKKTPPSGDVEALTRGMLRYCEAQKKKALRQGIQEQILAAQTDEEREELLKKLQALT